MIFEIIHYGDPVPAGRPRDRTFHNPVKYTEFKNKLAMAIRYKFSDFCIYTQAFKDNLTRKEKTQILKKRYGLLVLVYKKQRKGDTDNYLKAVKDAIVKANLIYDDEQIEFDYVGKAISGTPRIEFILYEIKNIDTLTLILLNYNKLKEIALEYQN